MTALHQIRQYSCQSRSPSFVHSLHTGPEVFQALYPSCCSTWHCHWRRCPDLHSQPDSQLRLSCSLSNSRHMHHKL